MEADFDAVMALIMSNATLDTIRDAVRAYGIIQYQDGWDDSFNYNNGD